MDAENNDEVSFDFEEYFKQFKRSMIGKNDYIFLVNDASNEIRQHYDKSYDGITFEEGLFRKQVLSKRNYLDNKLINYEFFVMPDKSVVLRDFLPFETNAPIRCVDNLSDCVVDLINLVDVGDYQYDDTHIKEESAIKIVSYILNKIHPDLSMDEYKQLLNGKLSIEEYECFPDLLFPVNWTWDRQHPLFKKFYASVKKRYIPKSPDGIITKEVPSEFNKMSSRETIYYKNNNSISDKKAIILRDSTTDKLIPVLTAYYNEILFYWDHFYFDKDLIDWFNPDDVIEIKTERFIANPIPAIVEENGTYSLLSSGVKINSLELIRPNTLHLWLDIPALRIMPVNAECDILLNNNVLSTEIMGKSSQNHIHYFLTNYPKEYLSNKLKVSVRVKKLIKR